MAAGPRVIPSVQVLRAIAALAVFCGHLAAEIANGGYVAVPAWSGVGAAGVDLFFVISGFVMVHVSRDAFGRPGAPTSFLKRRVTRIAPLYWLVSGVLLIHAVLRYNAAELAAADLSPAQLAASFLFVPWPRPSGDIEPLLRPGWTLSYEMFFYLAFAAGLTLPRRAGVGMTAALVLAAIAVGAAASWPQPIAVEFVYGMAIGLLAGTRRIPRAAALVLIAAGVLAIVGASGMPAHSPLRFLFWGVPAALVVAGATLHRFDLDHPAWAPLVGLGDASYALYLIHPFMSLPRIVLERRFGVDAGAWAAHPWLYAATLAAVVIPAAVLTHRLIEQPLINAARRLKVGRAGTAGGADLGVAADLADPPGGRRRDLRRRTIARTN